MHNLLSHAARQMRKYKGIGELLEDDLEKSHQDMDRLHRRIAGLGSCAKRAESLMHYQKAANRKDVKAAMEEVSKNSKRNLKRSSAQDRAGERKKAREQNRETRMEEVNSTEKGKVLDDLAMAMERRRTQK